MKGHFCFVGCTNVVIDIVINLYIHSRAIQGCEDPWSSCDMLYAASTGIKRTGRLFSIFRALDLRQ